MSTKKIAMGQDLAAVLEGEDLVLFNQMTDEVIVRTKATPRILRQFQTKMNHRAGQTSRSKANTIWECIAHLPEVEEYL